MTGKILFLRLLKTLGYTIAGVVLLLLSALALFQLSSQETRRDLLIGAVETATGGTLRVGTPFRLELGRELLQASLRSRERFWDIRVPKIDSIFDNSLVPMSLT